MCGLVIRTEGRAMIQEFGAEHVYNNHFEPREPGEKDYVLHFRDRGCLTRVTHVGGSDADAGDSGEVIDLPRLADYPRCPSRMTYLFSLGDERFFLALDETVPMPAGYAYESVNWLRHAEPQHLLFAAATASQLDRWYRENRFCGRCGHPTELAPSSREIVCPECARIVYPKICPGVIVAVVSLADDPRTTASCSLATRGAPRRSGRSSPASPRLASRSRIPCVAR